MPLNSTRASRQAAPDAAHDLLRQCLCLDLEAGRQGRIHQIGAVLDGQTLLRKGKFRLEEALEALDRLAASARLVLGHNIIDHDLPLLKAARPDLDLFDLPVLDTLYLSPLAFPENPYHRLVKGYKLVRDSANDPVADARLAASVFADQWGSFARMAADAPDLVRFFGGCFRESPAFGGLARVFQLAGKGAAAEPEALGALWERLAARQGCPAQVRAAGARLLPDAAERPAMAYALAWLRVSGGNSVLPPWVRKRFPGVVDLLKQVRERFCGDRDCPYCAENHDPVRQLRKYFGFASFRRLPDGTDLQQEIVACGMREESLLGILPTGFGKSVCFQLPALVRFQRRGVLTVVISPLQALMKDQVDNLRRAAGTPAVAAIHGMLTLPERGAVLEGVRLGDVGLLYLSPEQLRNRSVKEALFQREIGAFVFDEAHCLSKWGHDFRPDYLYAGRFLREMADRQQAAPPSIACLTATAKTDVIEEIRAYFRDELGQELTLFAGGVERGNLRFEVQMVTGPEKFGRVDALLEERLGRPPAGSAVVYCATRRQAEALAEYLAALEWPARAFHAGLTPPEKRTIQEDFVAGSVPVICATNAFGMGIDKEDVRLVVHADIPGSLENYLQEAGRAGRDLADADCVLLYDEADIETQFRLSAHSELRQRDIAQIWRALRKAGRKGDGEVVLTPVELLREEGLSISFRPDDYDAETKAKTAVAWLERAGMVARSENRTRVFQGRPLFGSLAEAAARLDQLNLAPAKRRVWEAVFAILINSDPDAGVSADQIAENLGKLPDMDPAEVADSSRVIDILHQMAEAGLIRQGLQMTAWVRPRGHPHARRLLNDICALDEAMLKALVEAWPVETVGEWVPLNLRLLNQQLVDAGFGQAHPEVLRGLLASLAQDGRGVAGRQGSIAFRHAFQEHYRVRLQRPWQDILAIAGRRRNLAHTLLNAILEKVPPEKAGQGIVLVEFSLQDLADAVARDWTLGVEPAHRLAAVDRGLLFLHEQKVIILQHGLSVFRQALTIRVLPQSRSRRYTKGDFEPLAQHYRQRIFQIHVMNEYARIGMERIRQAIALVMAYFSMDNQKFVRRFFPDRREMLQMATSRASFEKIVAGLGNAVQEAVVAAPAEENALILAGPGAGKTRVVVHRTAYLLRVKRVPPGSVLVLSFNHSAALELRRRLEALVGREAGEVTISTYHGLAMRLTGTSFAGAVQGLSDGETDLAPRFKAILGEAIALLEGEKELLGLERDAVRDRLLAGYQYILVDEYQDIDEDQYRLIAAITGRTLRWEGDGERRLCILAVGDDDQSIYGFREANVRFIRRFREDYRATVHHLVENYRSTRHIIHAANSLIRLNRERMKTDHPIRIDHRRERDPDGGAWEALDPVSQGRVQRHTATSAGNQARAVVEEIRRLTALSPGTAPGDFAVLARNGFNHAPLALVRAALEKSGIPFSYPLDKGASFPLSRVREFVSLVELLHPMRAEVLPACRLIELYAAGRPENPWHRAVLRLLEDWRLATGDAPAAVGAAIDFLYEGLAEQRREQRLGSGVCLSTAHGAKGLEFPHVLILDGDWQTPSDNARLEEERRLYYVAMTRARQTLTLFRRRDCRNPHVGRIDPASLLERASRPPSPLDEERGRRYAVWGMKQLFLDLAAHHPTEAPIHKALAALSPGDPLFLEPATGRNAPVRLAAADGQVVAQLARETARRWLPRLAAIERLTVLAVLKRRIDDTQPAYRSRIRCPEWEVPVVEVSHHLEPLPSEKNK